MDRIASLFKRIQFREPSRSPRDNLLVPPFTKQSCVTGITNQRFTLLGEPGSLQDRFDCLMITNWKKFFGWSNLLHYRLFVIHKRSGNYVIQHIAGFLYPQALNLEDFFIKFCLLAGKRSEHRLQLEAERLRGMQLAYEAYCKHVDFIAGQIVANNDRVNNQD